jgi:hypothetical protein
MKTDRELMEMALWALGIDCEDANGNKIDLVLPAIQALRERLSQPEPNAVLAEREACANVADIALLGCERSIRDRVVRAIKARGEK